MRKTYLKSQHSFLHIEGWRVTNQRFLTALQPRGAERWLKISQWRCFNRICHRRKKAARYVPEEVKSRREAIVGAALEMVNIFDWVVFFGKWAMSVAEEKEENLDAKMLSLPSVPTARAVIVIVINSLWFIDQLAFTRLLPFLQPTPRVVSNGLPGSCWTLKKCDCFLEWSKSNVCHIILATFSSSHLHPAESELAPCSTYPVPRIKRVDPSRNRACY